MGTLSSLKIPSNVKAVKQLFKTCCRTYSNLLRYSTNLGLARMEYSMLCHYPKFNTLDMSLQDISTSTGQNLYGIAVPIRHFLKSLDQLINLCYEKGLQHGHDSTALSNESSKIKLISALVRQLGVTGTHT